MTNISNAEKQARYRKKEHLKKNAESILRKWQNLPWTRKSKVTEEELQYSLDKAIDLPSGWKNEDYELALQALNLLKIDLLLTSDQLQNDVHAGYDALMLVPEPVKYINDCKAAVVNTRALASHLISALRISNCSDADQAAALMEAMRYVGRSLATKPLAPRAPTALSPRSQAVTACFAIINPHFSRPDWFAQELANMLKTQLGESLAQEVGKYLTKDQS